MIQALKEKVNQVLKDLQEKHEEDGLLSVYLWGSITTGEYVEGKSDIDSIAIVSKNHNLNLEQIKSEIAVSGIPDFGFNIVSTEELKTGNSVDNYLTFVINPRCLLDGMKNWELVAGKSFSVSDFTDNPPDPKELIQLKLKKIKRDNWLDISNVDKDFIVYYMKGLTRIIQYLQKDRGIFDAFSYNSINNNANSDEKLILKIFNELKSKDYNQRDFLTSRDTLNNFVNSVWVRYI